MKTQKKKEKLTFLKINVIELNDVKLNNIHAGWGNLTNTKTENGNTTTVLTHTRSGSTDFCVNVDTILPNTTV